MGRLAVRTKSDKFADTNWSVDCYFDRAMRFAKDDMIVRMIYADYLGRANREAEAWPSSTMSPAPPATTRSPISTSA